MTKNTCIRHGEALLVPVDTDVQGKEVISYIIAHSETGHHHVLESKEKFVVSETDKEFLIRLFTPAKLVHQKSYDMHKTLTVPAGTYKIIKKTEYDPFQHIIRAVWD